MQLEIIHQWKYSIFSYLPYRKDTLLGDAQPLARHARVEGRLLVDHDPDGRDFAQSRVACQPVGMGGGIRRLEDIEELLGGGISRVILGSAAADEAFLARAAERYGDRLAVGVDARQGRVAFNGWTQDSGEDYIAFAARAAALGVRNIIFTDIDCDGTLSHPNFAQLEALAQAVEVDITASGGIADITDIERLAAMGMYGAICGKSIYAGTLDLAAAVKAGKAYGK